MSYDRIGNYRIRENGRKINIFDKVNEIKQHLKDIIPEIKSDKLIVILSHCCIIKVKSHPKPNAFISLILPLVILRIGSPIPLKEYLINTNEKMNK